jgi:hypothetical protein
MIRLISAPAPIKEMVRRRLGPSTGASEEPDITITFTDTLPTAGPLRSLGLHEAAYDDESFYLLDRLGHRMLIDMATLGEPCEIVCERGVTSLPLLVPILSLCLLRKGYVLLHSSSFVHEGKGILVAGWQKGGKTEMALGFMAAGAEFVGNEWTIVSKEDARLYGVGGVLQVWDWHVRDLPEYWRRLPKADRRRLTLLRLYQRVYNALPRRGASQHAVGKALHQLSLEGGVSWLRQARVSPERLFRDALWQGPAPLDRIFLATVGAEGVAVVPADPRMIAQRMVASQAYERRQLFAAYDHYRFAFPDRSNDLLETAFERERSLLSEAFADRAAYEIVHPYPVPLEDLYRAAVPFCR